MEEKNPLPDTPEGGRSELIWACGTLCDAVRKISTHVVNKEIGEEIYSLIGKGGTRGRRGAGSNHLAGGKRWRVAVDTTYSSEKRPPIHGGRRVGTGFFWRVPR